jgi:hypothetical protein
MNVRNVLSILLVLLACGVMFAPASPAAGPAAKRTAVTGKKRLLLFAKNPSTWAIITGGAAGSMTYREKSGEFTLKAAGLHPRASYALIRYADAPPQADVIIRGFSDARGVLELRGSWYNWTRKFWLVAGEDVAGSGTAGKMTAWHPDRYLFEEKPLGIICDCPEPDVQD